ncbi:cupin domain-containing protein [Gordonia hydrophobica]|uniref:Cupin domain-containing protein n=1 Tax=Gordonia hydrophobica TaxID=40516 RepID=A0ABZ2U780_9ACTN|nr:cupin domain-containing protein [Gordonia hydrophobica]MBM7368012.1 quercetin dioxygenase-like cupin family protein [Gordonia hydrophobica]
MPPLDLAPTYTFLTGLDAPNDADTGEKPAIKRIHKSDTETVVRLAFRAGQVMAEHMAVHPILVLGQTGDVEFTVDGTTVHLEPGSAIRVEGRTPHSLRAVTDGTVTLVVVHGN